MKLIITLTFLCFFFQSIDIFAQTYKQFPINGEARYPIIDMDVYEDQVAIVGRRNYENILQVYLYKDNQWKSLPLTHSSEGEEKFIRYENKANDVISEVKFDAFGSLWLVGVDGIYNYKDERWIRYNLDKVNQELSSYKKLIFDKQGNIWVLIHVIEGVPPNSKGARRLYRFENGQFYQYLEHFGYYPDDFPMVNESIFDNRDIKNSGTLLDGVMLFGDKRYLGISESGVRIDLVYTKFDGTYNYLTIPTIDKPFYNESVKKLNRIYVDSKNRVWFLMRFQQGYNQNTGVETACCSGIARLDNLQDWYTYTQDNNTPYSMNFNDQHIRYATPVDMCELKNNEYLFVMQNNGYTEPKNLQLFKLNSDNKFDTLQWKSYLQHATIFRPDYTIISEENLKKEIDILMNGDPVQSKLEIKRMLADKYGNIWIAGENFILKMTDDPTTSVAVESIKKPTVIYPNPGNQTIRLSNIHNEVSKIEIQNLTGRTVKTILGNFNEIPISELSNGMYFVKIFSQNGNVDVVKFIKE
jgi:hypothetical protein